MKIEYELKFYPIDLEETRKKLASLNTKLLKKMFLQKRQIFDVPNKDSYKQWLRIRYEGNKITVTLKRIVNNSIEGTYESEFLANDFEKACNFFSDLGFIQKSYQENYREEWQLDDCLIALDIWPGLKPLIEIEGLSKQSVEKIAQKLDFELDNAMYGSIDLLYEKVLNLDLDKFNSIPVLTFDKGIE